MGETGFERASPWQHFREQMPIAARWSYFDHASVAPLPASTAAAIAAFSHEAAHEGDTVWPAWNRRVEECRTLAARLIGADEAQVALVHSTTEGLSLVAEGYPWQAGDNVVTLENEFPSNQYPWLNLAARGVETRRVVARDGRVDLNELAAACNARTRIVSASWVGYLTGWRTDLDALAEVVHAKDALLCVDAIQGLGVFPLDVRATPIDFLAADGHKWLLGPEGAGVFYLRSEHLDLLRPVGVGWHSVQRASDYGHIELALKPTAARYEGGTQNMVGFIGLAASLEVLSTYGAAAISQRVLEITDLACQRLNSIGAVLTTHREGEHRSSIVSFELSGQDALALKRRLLAAGVVTSARGGKLRIAAHAYNNVDDIDRLIDALRGA
jgi:cysteine desulfurase/selenocysteine lyase